MSLCPMYKMYLLIKGLKFIKGTLIFKMSRSSDTFTSAASLNIPKISPLAP